MGCSDLRVINEDFVRPGMGFETHGHRDMEIVTWVLPERMIIQTAAESSPPSRAEDRRSHREHDADD